MQALYGSQYSEIAAAGKDGNKGRVNGNIFLAAFIILIILDVLLAFVISVPGINEHWANKFHSLFGYLSGKTIGQILMVPVFALVYFTVTRTVGSEQEFQKHVAAFKQSSEEEKLKANKKILLPFLILVGLLFVMAMSSLIGS